MKKLLLTLLLLSTSAFADTANITWEAPTTREDTTPLLIDQISGYRIYLDGTKVVDNIPAIATVYTLDIVGTKVLNMTTVDIDGRESAFSPDIIISGSANPDAPKVTVTITINISSGVTDAPR